MLGSLDGAHRAGFLSVEHFFARANTRFPGCFFPSVSTGKVTFSLLHLIQFRRFAGRGVGSVETMFRNRFSLLAAVLPTV